MPKRMSAQVTRTRTVQFYIMDCIECSVPFAVTDEFDENRRWDHRSFYCPNGHSQSYDAENITEQLRRQLNEAQSATASARRELGAAKGSLTRLRQRVENGVCPCCHRHFTALERHIKGQHPDFLVKE